MNENEFQFIEANIAIRRVYSHYKYINEIPVNWSLNEL